MLGTENIEQIGDPSRAMLWPSGTLVYFVWDGPVTGKALRVYIGPCVTCVPLPVDMSV